MRSRNLIVLFLSLTGMLIGQQTRRIDDAVLRTAGKTGEEWLTYGLTPGETRYSPLKQIDTSNVSRLGLNWSYDVGQGGGNQEATPLFWNGVLYGITNWSVVFAVDARTGKVMWSQKVGSAIMSQPIAFMGPDKREYIAVYSGVGGGAGVNRRVNGFPPGGNTLYVFSVDGMGIGSGTTQLRTDAKMPAPVSVPPAAAHN